MELYKWWVTSAQQALVPTIYGLWLSISRRILPACMGWWLTWGKVPKAWLCQPMRVNHLRCGQLKIWEVFQKIHGHYNESSEWCWNKTNPGIWTAIDYIIKICFISRILRHNLRKEKSVGSLKHLPLQTVKWWHWMQAQAFRTTTSTLPVDTQPTYGQVVGHLPADIW